MRFSELFSVPLPTRRSTVHLAKWLASGLHPSDLIVLVGPLGAGKTFLVRALARQLGLSVQHRVTSPTFALVHYLPTTPPVVHADLYRLADIDELQHLGLRDERVQGAVVIVEWGEQYIDALGGQALVVRFDVKNHRRVAVIQWAGTTRTHWHELAAPTQLAVQNGASAG